jgi:predicted enzyme related to lactoylglutathione lyase
MKGVITTTTALPAQDLERARAFYRDILRLGDPEAVEEEPAPSFRYTLGGTQFLVFKSAGEPSGTHTQMAFHVDDAYGAAADLQSRGVEFEDVEGMEQVNGIVTMGDRRGGWFKDSEGNMLGLLQDSIS